MYGGVGLRTPRGSGTNGYVQRSLATMPTTRIGKTEGQADTISRPRMRVDPELLLHEKKRNIEVKLMELRIELEGKMSLEDVEKEVAKKRDLLYDELEKSLTQIPDVANPEMKSHMLAATKAKQLEKLQKALKLDDRNPGRFESKSRSSSGEARRINGSRDSASGRRVPRSPSSDRRGSHDSSERRRSRSPVSDKRGSSVASVSSIESSRSADWRSYSPRRDYSHRSSDRRYRRRSSRTSRHGHRAARSVSSSISSYTSRSSSYRRYHVSKRSGRKRRSYSSSRSTRRSSVSRSSSARRYRHSSRKYRRSRHSLDQSRRRSPIRRSAHSKSPRHRTDSPPDPASVHRVENGHSTRESNASSGTIYKSIDTYYSVNDSNRDRESAKSGKLEITLKSSRGLPGRQAPQDDYSSSSSISLQRGTRPRVSSSSSSNSSDRRARRRRYSKSPRHRSRRSRSHKRRRSNSQMSYD